jgi:uncharacterized protein
MYFATLTEVPILQGLIASGMGKGPALALLLAGPALSLPNMLVIRGVMGTQKTVVFVSLVVVMATMSGLHLWDVLLILNILTYIAEAQGTRYSKGSRGIQEF